MRISHPLLVCLVACAPAALPLAPTPTASTASRTTVDASAVRAEGISARIRFLSDDLLEGRFTGSRGHAIAERYVATELQSMGAEPAGDHGTFLQAVPMRGALKDASGVALALKVPGKPELPLKLEDDYVLNSDLRTPVLDAEAPLVFAGYGVTAPEYRYDDLAGLDLKGKIVVVFNRAPLSDRDDWFPPIAHAVYSDSREKAKTLAARGAIGMLVVFRPDDEQSIPWPRVAKQSRIEQVAWTKNGEPESSPKGMTVRGVIAWRAFDAILARAGKTDTTATLLAKIDAHAGKSFELGASAHVRLTTKLRDFEGHNVVGVLRGSDPKLASEYVVYSAHLDHLGIGAPSGADEIYNGALDNASGTASILEIARAYSLLPKRPARSVLFLSCTGEERGLLGSEYFAENPTVPAGSIVADFNSDMILALHAPLHDVVVLGGDHTTLGPLADAAAKSLGLATSPDPEPKEVHFIRSDQYSFVRKGIPSLNVEAGVKDERGATADRALARKSWIASHYHAATDEWAPTYDYEGMAQVARVNFLTGLAVANTPGRPAWNERDSLAKLVGH